jgi:hypothetical protein
MMQTVSKPRRLQQSSSLAGMFDPIPSILPATILEEHSIDFDDDEDEKSIILAPNPPVPPVQVSTREHLLQINLRRAKRRFLLESVQQESPPPDPIAEYNATTEHVSMEKMILIFRIRLMKTLSISLMLKQRKFFTEK